MAAVSGRRRWLFVATILTGSFLLFLVQPLVARMALPRLGGAPAVWNSAMLVYQALLLGGYAYAHALSRLTIARQAAIHLAVLVLAGLTLPIALADVIPLTTRGLEAFWVPLLFLFTIGPVFFAVAAQAPLMQRWYAADPQAGDPYWLYAASNLGSFAGLIAYPLLLEPNLPLGRQSLVWSAGYALLIVLVAAAAWARRGRSDRAEETMQEEHDGAPIGWRRVALWLALSAVPSGLMLSTTTHLTTDIVAMPLLWVIPLGLYLLSFVFAFNERSALGFVLARVAPVIVLLAGGMAMVSQSGGSFSIGLATVLMLFVVATALHRRLYLLRPSPARLTYFYLVMSAGGALGGVFTALVAPLVFDWVWEHPILVLAAAALLPDRPLFAWMDRLGLDRRGRRIAVLLLLIAAVAIAGAINGWLVEQRDSLVLVGMMGAAVCGILVLGQRRTMVVVLLVLMLGRGGWQTLDTSFEGARDRSYFGVYTVREQPEDGLQSLISGTTLHGLQFTDPDKARRPTTYYGPDSGAGAALQALPAIGDADARVGVVGLGVGTLACYRRPGQRWEFFEIDATVLRYSRDGTFGFLTDCAPEAPIHLGDARLVLDRFGQVMTHDDRFDALVIDAFSSDAIPLHLVTTEAFGIYRRVLADDGLLMVHISNRFVDLTPMMAALAREHGMLGVLRLDQDPPPDPSLSASIWVVMSPDAGTLAALLSARPDLSWHRLANPAEPVWTDDFASILPFIQWHNVLGSGS
ncbi:spermidine synthase [Qipengyuania sp. MTN3-11]|uniref:spermidine synthase n=1 Tax=Qipengyuania sp. MTN3-11 TaxID=3056557 RepID=UPI0036F44362